MNETKYLLDNNVLGSLGSKRRSSAFFTKHCRVPTEVAWEARRGAFAETLTPLTVEMTPAILQQLTQVMKTVPVGHTKFIDLYGNKGGADPILVAVAYVLNNPKEPDLFADQWVIVSNDKEVKAKAAEFFIDIVTPTDLASTIDSQ